MSGVHLHIHPQGASGSGYAEIVLDNPSRLNALTIPMLELLEQYCKELDSRDDIRVVIVRSEGDRAFCAGADINAWSPMSPMEFARVWVRNGHRLFNRLAQLSKPTIAVIHAMAAGGGLELAAACDIRIIGPTAHLSLPEASVGIVPGWSGTQRLQRLLPESVIKEMALFGIQLTADRAERLGFVAQVTDTPLEAAYGIAKKTFKLSPCSVEIIKYMLHAGSGEDSRALIEALGSGLISSTQDKQEGVAAFKDKRKPDFAEQLINESK